MSHLGALVAGRFLPPLDALPTDVRDDLDALLGAGWPETSAALLLTVAAREPDDDARRATFRRGVRELRAQFAEEPPDELLDALAVADRLLAAWGGA